MVTVISECKPGDKLPKPRELKGVKPAFSYKWGGVTSCPVFVVGNDIWIKHRDWCSLIMYGRSDVKYSRHFLYSDGFTAPTIKGTAYIRIEGSAAVKLGHRAETIRRVQRVCGPDSRFCSDDMRMFIDVLMKIWRLQHDKI